MNKTLKFAMLLTACVALAACNKKVKETETDTSANTGNSQNQGGDQGSAIAEQGAFTPADLDSNSCLMQRVIYFDYDQDLLKPEYQAIVACHAKYLRDRPGAQMRLEGHADERGTREYNMALGERRANGVNSAFTANAADSSRIDVVSSGEERPVCLDSAESCWSQNRRVVISYSVK
jgi:peptidoglycan-associated lipoprotein